MPQTHPFNVNNYYSINASSFQIIILKPIATNYLLGYKMPLKRPVELEIVGYFAYYYFDYKHTFKADEFVE